MEGMLFLLTRSKEVEIANSDFKMDALNVVVFGGRPLKAVAE